jgi:hypothetical protein
MRIGLGVQRQMVGGVAVECSDLKHAAKALKANNLGESTQVCESTTTISRNVLDLDRHLVDTWEYIHKARPFEARGLGG